MSLSIEHSGAVWRTVYCVGRQRFRRWMIRCVSWWRILTASIKLVVAFLQKSAICEEKYKVSIELVFIHGFDLHSLQSMEQNLTVVNPNCVVLPRLQGAQHAKPCRVIPQGRPNLVVAKHPVYKFWSSCHHACISLCSDFSFLLYWIP